MLNIVKILNIIIFFLFLSKINGYTPFDRIVSNNSVTQKELPEFMNGIISLLNKNKGYEIMNDIHMQNIKDIKDIKDIEYKKYKKCETTIFLIMDYNTHHFHFIYTDTDHTDHNNNKDHKDHNNNKDIYYLVLSESIKRIDTYEEFLGLFEEYKFLYYEYYEYYEYMNLYDELRTILQMNMMKTIRYI